MKYYKSTTEYNCGIDLHSRQMYVCLMDKEGTKLLHTNIKGNDFGYFLNRIEPYRHDLTVVCESTFNWYWLADACCDTNIEFVLAHALYLKHIHGGKNKNDRIDSEKLAHLLRANLIPPAYVYPSNHRPMRALLRQRMSYVWERSSLIGHLTMNQYAEGMVPVHRTNNNRDEWEERVLNQYTDPLLRMAAQNDMELIRSYDKRIHQLEKELGKQAKKAFGRDYLLLETIPGIGRILALTLLFEIDTIERFPTVKDFVSYCRLVKGSVASAGKVKGLAGGKMGNAYLRWAFGQAAIIARRSHPHIRTYGDLLIAKHGKFKANAILGNKIARAVYFMLQKGTVFDVEQLIATSI
jgi:transposase